MPSYLINLFIDSNNIYRLPKRLLPDRISNYDYRSEQPEVEDSLLFLLSRLQNLKRAKQRLINAHHSASIVEFTTVIGRREQRDELTLREELVSVFHHLMRTAYEIHVVFLQEAGNDIRSEGEGHAAVVFAPACDVLIGVGPEEIAEETAVWDLLSVSTCIDMMTSMNELTSVGLITRLICSIEFKSGLSPPCIVKIFSSMMAAIGKQLKQSVNVFHSLML